MEHFTSVEPATQWLRLCTQKETTEQRKVLGMLHSDSRKVSAGDAFIAWPGAAVDGRRFVEQALQSQGASACLVEADGLDAYADSSWMNSTRVASYKGLKEATGRIASAFYLEPSKALDVIAVTGTNGKSSVAWWLASVLSRLEGKTPIRCGVVGTLGIGELPGVLANGLTTPDPVLLQASLRDMADNGVSYCAIEASSIGLEEHRLDGTRLQTAVFTNFTQDHLDYHGNLDAYWQAKRQLFDWPGLVQAVVNVDDPKGQILAVELGSKALDLWTVSLQGSARLRANAIKASVRGMQFEVVEYDVSATQVLQTAYFDCPVMGHFNVMNVLCVVAVLRSKGFALAHIAKATEHLDPVPGRMERVAFPGGPAVAVDYAHTPDALNKVLAALQTMAQARQGKLWCVFGCGGNRDAAKRPLMASAVEQWADHIIVTSDNPRNEMPQQIIADVVKGFSAQARYQVEPDRPTAVWKALTQAQPNDWVLLAGKGHEPYQEVMGLRRVYSDIDWAKGLGGALAQPMMTLADCAAAIPGARVLGNAALSLSGVGTDTRTLLPGQLFVALRGEQFDGHNFVAQAYAKGAVAALVDQPVPEVLMDQLVVPDTRIALGLLAKMWRARFAGPLIAVTGSNGKTTVTQLLATVLRLVHGDNHLATQGNLNNDIGLPLTLLKWRSQHQRAVIEMGMNHPGEIAYLAGIAQPTVALVNNAQREHLEFMGTVEAVARENGSVFASTDPNGSVVFPADDTFANVWRSLAAGRKVLTFALDDGADVFARSVQWQDGVWQVLAATPQGDCHFTLAVAGRHNVKNALAALACAIASGISAQQAALGISQFTAVKGRSRSLRLEIGGRAITLVDDTYNANPDSMRAAVDVLADLPQPSFLVVGDMGEVGDNGPAFHRELGQYAKDKGIHSLLATGQASVEVVKAFGGGQHFDHRSALIAAVLDKLPGHASVLVKGSRFMKMEQVIAAIVDAATPQEEPSHVA
jgi:murE/murF fusion protein